MSSSTQLEHYDVPSSNPLETPTFSFRVGKHLGRFFVAAKNKATDKYKQVTSGINQSIEDEEARRLCELQMMLDSQAEEYEAIIDDVQRTWLKRTTLSYSFSTLRGIFTLRGKGFPCCRRKLMKVTLHNSCLAYLAKHNDSESLIEEVRTQALNAWENRGKDVSSTRIMVNIPSQYGQKYHFFTVSPYANRKDLLSVRG